MRVTDWWQRRKAARVDGDLLEEMELKERFLGPIDPATGRRPVDARDFSGADRREPDSVRSPFPMNGG